MKGVRFVFDDKGNTTSLLIDVNEIGEEWHDLIDGLIAKARNDEPVTSWEAFKQELNAQESNL